jgi:hypothetical protein
MSRSYQSPSHFNLDSKHYVKLSVPTSDTTVVAKSVYHTLHQPSQGWVSKFSLVHMLGELFSRIATIQGLRRGVGGAGERVWFITLLLPRFSVEAVGVVHECWPYRKYLVRPVDMKAMLSSWKIQDSVRQWFLPGKLLMHDERRVNSWCPWTLLPTTSRRA